jgi:preprotein translocase subunit SecG
MSWLHTFALIIHMLCTTGIIGLVLLQRGKGAEAGAGFGAGASGTVFGARGSGSFLSHMTAVLAAVFFITSLSLAYLGSTRPAQTSVVDTATKATQTKTVDPVPVAPAPAVEAPAVAPTSEPVNEAEKK